MPRARVVAQERTNAADATPTSPASRRGGGLTTEEYKALNRQGNKYGAKRCEEDGYQFASQAERAHYRELKRRASVGEIEDLEVHPAYPLVVNGQKVGRFTLDFGYFDKAIGRRVIVDVKGGRATRTEAYRLRVRLLKALYDLDVTEVG